MRPWMYYFHFESGTVFDVDGPGGYNGAGRVLDNSDTRLSLRLDLDAWGPAPALHAAITITYNQEGPGNEVVVEEDNTPPKKDANAVIRSFDARRERAIDSGAMTFSVRYDGEDEIDLDVLKDGRRYDFDLIRKRR